MTRRLNVSEVAEKYLTGWLEAVMTGEIPLWRLPPSVAAFYHAGYAEGRTSRQQEISDLERELNRLHIIAFYPESERKQKLLDRLHNRLDEFSEEEWDRLETVIKNIAAQPLGGAAPNIEPADNAEIEGNNDGSIGTPRLRREAA